MSVYIPTPKHPLAHAKPPRLGVNIDHVATLRNARGVPYPSPYEAALMCQSAGCDGITLHLREDRRHIVDADVSAICRGLDVPINLEMAATKEMCNIAISARPTWVCLVPERRNEVTTEGGLDVKRADLSDFIARLQHAGIRVSLFIDPDTHAIARAIALGADAIELHTGAYANAHLAKDATATAFELGRIKRAVAFALSKHPTFLVNAGHGLTKDNVAPIAQIPGIYELNIGHALIGDAVFCGLTGAVNAMRIAMGHDT